MVGEKCTTLYCILFHLFWEFPCGSAGKESTCNVGDLGSIPGLGRSPGEGKSYPLQYSWPGELHGLYSPWGLKESDTTERLSLHFIFMCLFPSIILCLPWEKAILICVSLMPSMISSTEKLFSIEFWKQAAWIRWELKEAGALKHSTPCV